MVDMNNVFFFFTQSVWNTPSAIETFPEHTYLLSSWTTSTLKPRWPPLARLSTQTLHTGEKKYRTPRSTNTHCFSKQTCPKTCLTCAPGGPSWPLTPFSPCNPLAPLSPCGNTTSFYSLLKTLTYKAHEFPEFPLPRKKKNNLEFLLRKSGRCPQTRVQQVITSTWLFIPGNIPYTTYRR